MDSARTSIGAYEILAELGRGGMAVLYQAYDRANRRVVALKVLPAYLAHDPDLLRRFLREGQDAAALQHPNIVGTFEVGEAGGVHFIAMEFLPGGSVAEMLARQGRPFDLATTLSVVSQVAAALDYAHEHGVLHRDVKLRNILLDGRGRAVLGDFGIAKVASHFTLTPARSLIGTPHAMSPEQARGQSDLDRRSDVYALGVALYEMLTGQPPFQGEYDAVIVHKILYEAPPAPRSLNPAIPPAVERVILTALQKDRAKRYASAGQMAAALQAAVAATTGKRVATPQPHTPVPTQPRTPASRRPHTRSTWLYVVAAAAFVALAFVWLVISTRDGSPGLPPSPTAGASSLIRSATVSSSAPMQGQIIQDIYLYRTPTDQHSPIFRLNRGDTVTIITPNVSGTPFQGSNRWHRVKAVYQGRDVAGYISVTVVRVE